MAVLQVNFMADTLHRTVPIHVILQRALEWLPLENKGNGVNGGNIGI